MHAFMCPFDPFDVKQKAAIFLPGHSLAKFKLNGIALHENSALEIIKKIGNSFACNFQTFKIEIICVCVPMSTYKVIVWSFCFRRSIDAKEKELKFNQQNKYIFSRFVRCQHFIDMNE